MTLSRTWRGAAAWALITLTSWSVAAGPVLAQTLGQGSNASIAWWRVFGATLLCLALGIAGIMAIKARRDGVWPSLAAFDWRNLLTGNQTPVVDTKRLRVVETVRLPHQVDVSLLTCDDVQVLIATSPHGAFIVAPGEGVTGKSRV